MKFEKLFSLSAGARAKASLAQRHAQVLDSDNGELSLAAMPRLMERPAPGFKD